MQLWYFNGGFIVNKRSGFVLDVVVGAKCQTGTRIVQYQKHDEPSRGQEWEYNYEDNSFYLKFNRNFVLDVSGTNIIHLWDKHGGKNQQFISQKWDGDSAVIENSETNIIDNFKFLPKLSQNFLEILDDDEYYDVNIEVANWMEQNFDLIYQTSYEIDSFLDLQSYYNDLISNEPDKIFKSPQITVIQNDNLQISEIQVWEHVLKWGVSQNSAKLPSNLEDYLQEDFNTLKNTLRQYIPFIRFYNLTSKEVNHQ
ncbi:hypothetical protein RhiirA5_438255 [Rhizophagus irregularis]|uniref:Uncharacterized protein n=1 Tax=Rhizophagus irregularis TaxID=588596 RepID=A0A2N0NJD1_9GLOM|nr:hypothetical protein RhiirA5_438255 [Rhizophagus irregularis]